MKSAGSSHSNAVMNSWSSMPNEYVVWFLIAGELLAADRDVLVHRALAVLGRSAYHGRTFTNG